MHQQITDISCISIFKMYKAWAKNDKDLAWKRERPAQEVVEDQHKSFLSLILK